MNDADLTRLADWLVRQHREHGVRRVGLNGAQGSGKSTLAQRLPSYITRQSGLRAAVLSLDDLYLPRADRQRLATTVHPLLATRGVPGTHDVALGEHLLQTIPALAPDEPLRLPRFVKLLDDRAPEHDAPCIHGPVDLLLFEGWCVGTPAQDAAALAAPINTLERDEDADGRWRRWVNARLAEDYAPRLFAPLQRLVFLQAPDFDTVFRWRRQQEHGSNRRDSRGGLIMDDAALRRFIAHYERLTRQALAQLPSRADAVLALDDQRRCRTLHLSG